MALTKAKKAEKVAQLAKELEGSTSAIVGTFAKLTVAQDFELRKTVRAAGGRYRVLKNKLAARASKGSQIEAALQGLKGVSSVAYTSGDPVALAKALSTWVEENAQFTFKLGIVDGKVINVERSEGAGDHAGQGRDLRKAALPHQFSGAASGDRHQRNRPRPGRGDQPGGRAEQVFRRAGFGGTNAGSRAAAGGGSQLAAAEAAPVVADSWLLRSKSRTRRKFQAEKQPPANSGMLFAKSWEVSAVSRLEGCWVWAHRKPQDGRAATGTPTWNDGRTGRQHKI